MVITIIIWVFWLHQDIRFLFLRRTISLAWYEYRKLIWFGVSNQSAPHNTVSVRGLTPEWLIPWSTIHSRKTREEGSTIINSYCSRSRRIWADIYNQQGRRPVIINSYPASPRRITVLVHFQAILLISSGESSSNRDIFFTDDVAKKFFRPPKFRHKKLIITNLNIV